MDKEVTSRVELVYVYKGGVIEPGIYFDLNQGLNLFNPKPKPTQEKFLLDRNIFVDNINDRNIMEESKNTAKNKIKGIRDNQKRSNKETIRASSSEQRERMLFLKKIYDEKI